MNDGDDMPELPDDRPATGTEIDARLEHTDRELGEIRGEIAKLRESMRASLAGDHERADEILDELKSDGSKMEVT
jgi:hypothetical protein